MIRIAAPTDQVISLHEMKEHLRVAHDDEDLMIQSLTDAAVSWLDGWDGVLGRCIMPQTWRISPADLVAGFRLPDASDVVVEPDGSLLVTCAMPPEKLPQVQQAVKLLVGQWYENRSGVNIGNITSDLSFAVRALLEPLRNA